MGGCVRAMIFLPLEAADSAQMEADPLTGKCDRTPVGVGFDPGGEVEVEVHRFTAVTGKGPGHFVFQAGHLQGHTAVGQGDATGSEHGGDREAAEAESSGNGGATRGSFAEKLPAPDDQAGDAAVVSCFELVRGARSSGAWAGAGTRSNPE